MVAISENSMPSSEAGRRRTQPLVNHLHQGMTLDAVTGLHDECFRNSVPNKPPTRCP